MTKADGASCATATDCNSNFCEDGVCCDTLCGGGEPNDCVSCLGAMTGGVDGVCGTVDANAHYVCRPAVGACDVASVCPGGLLNVLCPPDTVQPAGTVCQAAGICNAQSTCTGASPICPTSNTANGTACGAGEICANGVCATDCDIAGVIFSGGTQRPLNQCQFCNPTVSTSAWSNEPDGMSCTGGVCATGACAADCFIAGKLYPAGTVNPANACQVCTPANSTTMWSDEPDGTACGAGQLCSSGTCAAECTINGQHVASGTVNPLNPCQVCNPATSTTDWSDEPSGTNCTVLLIPDGVCDNGACVADCYIAGMFYPLGTVNPSNPCQVCEPTNSRSAWSNEPDGLACGSGEVCSGGSCQMDCVIGGLTYAAGQVNPGNPCQVCAPSSSTTMWSSEPAGSDCATLLVPVGVCDGKGACAGDCYIGGTLYAAGAVNPANACQVCAPVTSRTSWTNSADGTPCGTGEVCSSGTCADDCVIGGATVPSGTVNPLNPCEVCNPAISTTSFSNQPIGTGCGLVGGEVCDGTGTCTADCFIGGTLYAGGTIDPANACLVCAPAQSTSTWSNVPNGIICGTGNTCSNGVCAAVCDIGGTTYPAGATNPTNPCQVCNAAVSTSTWTNDPDGSTCGFGRICVSAGCVADCYIGGMAYPAGTVNPANACQQCVPTTSTTTWSNEPDGTTCGTNQLCVNGQCGVCTINGTTFLPGAVNPANNCQVCTPASSTTSWSNVPNGNACGFGEVCSAGACTADCFIGGKLYAPGAPNPANACQVCAPNTSTTTWTNQGDGTNCGNSQVCLDGACGACVINGVTYPQGTVNPMNSCQECIPTSSTSGWSTAPDGTTCPGGVCTGGSCMPSGSSSSSSGSASTGSGSASTGSGAGGSGTASTGSGTASTSSGIGTASTSSGTASTSSGIGAGGASTGSGSASNGSTSSGIGAGGASTGSGSASNGSTSSGIGAGGASTGSGSASNGSTSSGTGASTPNETGVVAEGGGCRCGAVGSEQSDKPWLGLSMAFLAALSLGRRRRS